MRARDPDAAFQRYQRRQRPADLAATFDATAPELLRVAAHLAPTLAEAEDLVQETFLVAMDRHAEYVPGGAGVLAWLLGVLRNRALRQRRESKRELDGERVLARARSAAEPILAAQGSELAAEVREAIERVPSAYRAALRMHLVDGMSAPEIALALQRPAATVRAQIARGLARLRKRLPAGLAGSAVVLSTERGIAAVRKVVLAQAVARAPLAVSAAGIGLAGVLTMKKTMIAFGLLVAVASLSWYALDATSAVTPPPDATAGATMAAEREGSTREDKGEALDRDDLSVTRAPVATTSAEPIGDLTVIVAYEDGDAASGVGLTVSRSRERDRVGLQHATTDGAGRADFTGLPAGSVLVEVDRGGQDREQSYPEVVAGERREVKLTIRVALTLAGEVRDWKGEPVAGAEIWLVPAATSIDSQPVTRTDARGRFFLKSGHPSHVLSARADGYAPSFLQYVAGEKGKSRTDLVLVLPEPGGSVAGIVRGPDGKPVAHALVRVGSGQLDHVAIGMSARPLPAQARTDGEGRFHATGIPIGEQPVTARGPGTAPWSGKCAVRAGETTQIEIELPRGNTVFGRVTDAAGQPVHKALVTTGEEGTLAQSYAWSDREGAYRLYGLAARIAVITATHDADNDRRTLPSVAASQRLDLVVSREAGLRGDLRTLEGAPVRGAVLEFWDTEADTDALPKTTAKTDADGRWAIGRSRSGKLLRVRARHPSIETVERASIDPSLGELHLTARVTGRWALAKAVVRGRLLWPDGAPVAGARVELGVSGDIGRGAITDADGSFRIDGVLPGEGRLRYTASGQPTAIGERCVLEAGSTRDVGDVTLPRGEGRIQVRCQPPLPGLLALVYYDDAWLATLWEETEYRSPPLVPGKYRISVEGFGIAAMTLSATVQAGTDVVVDVRAMPGYEQTFEISARSGWTSEQVRMEITPAGEPPIVTYLTPEAGRALSYAAFLRPGAHTVRVQSGSDVQEASFTVALGAREVVRLNLP